MKSSFFALALSFVAAPAAFAKDVTLRVAPARSTVQWTGSKVVGGGHTGKVSIKDGTLVLADGKVKSGEVVVDMKSIVNEDLKDQSFNQKLVGHLKSADFFDVDKHPDAKIKIEKVEYLASNERRVHGQLTIKGKTAPVTFTAREEEAAGSKLVKADLTFDRTTFDVRYGSGKFFQNLGDKMISDEVQLAIELALEEGEKAASK